MATVIISTDITLTGSAPALPANTLTYVFEDVSVISTASNALSNKSSSDNVDVRVDGLVYGELRAIFLQSDGLTSGHSLTVGATGRVLANHGFGAEIEGAGGSLLNSGEISATHGAGVTLQGNNGVAVNYGIITSMTENGSVSEAVQITGAGVLLQNFGVISALGAASAGIDGGSQIGMRVENYGIISGVSQAIIGGTSTDRIVNAGQLSGAVFLGSGDDNFNGLEGGAASVIGETGNDVLRGSHWEDTLSGSIGDDIIVGRGDDDFLQGGDGNDIMRGNAGDDTITGGLGTDTMNGGTGSDTFVFGSGDLGSGAAADFIKGFKSGEDAIDLSDFGTLIFIASDPFSGLTGELRYVKSTGLLSADIDGDTVADFTLAFTPRTVLSAFDLIL